MSAGIVDTERDQQQAAPNAPPPGTLPNRLMTAFEVAEFVGCHKKPFDARTCAGCSRRNDSV